jgi:hypothetical protein
MKREVTHMATTLEELLEVLAAAEEQDGSRATSVRLPEALHRAVLLATELGMDESFTAAMTRALQERIGDFVRRRALAEHFTKFPADLPRLADVAKRRIQGSEHPGVSHPELVDEAAAWVEQRRPEWAFTAVDDTVDEVLGYVEMLVAGVGRPRRRSA